VTCGRSEPTRSANLPRRPFRRLAARVPPCSRPMQTRHGTRLGFPGYRQAGVPTAPAQASLKAPRSHLAYGRANRRSQTRTGEGRIFPAQFSADEG